VPNSHTFRHNFVVPACVQWANLSSSEKRFDWDASKNAENRAKHGVAFTQAQYAFADPNRVIAEDTAHSEKEKRYCCFGEVDAGVVTLRFTYRDSLIRIFGAGDWRKGKAIYERENQIHQ